MSIFKNCERRTIQIDTLDGEGTEVAAWVYADLAYHKVPGLPWYWSITHLPTGLSFQHWFASPEGAAEAMAEIAALRNDWVNLSGDDVRALKKPVFEICARYGGERTGGKPRPGGLPSALMNGYSRDEAAA